MSDKESKLAYIGGIVLLVAIGIMIVGFMITTVIVRSLDNKKVKSYVELNGKLPDGVESTGYILRKTLKGE